MPSLKKPKSRYLCDTSINGNLSMARIKQDPKNYRKHSDRNKELIKKSLQKLGAGRSIVVDNEDYIVAGNGVHEQAEALGIPIKVIESDGSELIVVKRTDISLNDPRRKELALADNATSDTSEWDSDNLMDEWSETDLNEWDVNIDWSVEAPPAEEDFDAELPPEPQTVLGDLYELNGHRVLCDSCTDSDAVVKLLGGNQIDLYLTDPPYGVSYIGKTEDALTIQNDALTEEQTHELWRECLLALWPHLKSGGVIYATVPPGPLHIGFADALHEINALRQILVWAKSSMVMGRSDYHYQHEPILYGWKPGAAHYFIDDRTKTTVINAPKPNANREHPTMKPLELWDELISNSSKPKDCVYDSFLGSGTTLISCEGLARTCYGTELDPKYCDVIVKRWVKYMQDAGREFTVKRNGEDITNEEWLTE
jgi:DNA modification methylase